MNIGDVEISLLISIATALVAVGGFSLTRRKERDANVQHQAHIDAKLEQIQDLLSAMKEDISEIKETSNEHRARIVKLELITDDLQKNLRELAAVFRGEKGL